MRDPIGKPEPVTFRFEKYSDQKRFLDVVERMTTTQSIILRKLAMAYTEHVEKYGHVEFPVRLVSHRDAVRYDEALRVAEDGQKEHKPPRRRS
jgi:hypothetical protein